ncbi:MAG: sugar phosphate nucleotidyltransferase [Bacillota bacterium]|nr:sugar phosphate nucleotidyltransferase [Bacillota bacterium]
MTDTGGLRMEPGGVPVFAVILAGGLGTRFWPRSRRHRPKQFMSFAGGDESLLQSTASRLGRLVPPANTIVVTHHPYEIEVARQLPGIGAEGILVEPAARNTGPAVALAALHIVTRCGRPDAVMLVAPSDHRVEGPDEFSATVAAAIGAAAGGAIVTIGVRPTRPETGYGYILPGKAVYSAAGRTVLAVRRFVEKPDRRRAARYLSDGRYLWNAGIFAWQAGTILEAMGRHDIGAGQVLAELSRAAAPDRMAALYAQLPAVPVDRWVLERERGVVTVPAAFGWDDLGSWSSLRRTNVADGDGNVVLGPAVTVETGGCIIDAAGGRVVATLGVRDLIIVDTGDVLLVCDRRRDQDIKLLQEELRRAGLDHLL